jgi:hypothetical protein
MDNYSSNVSIPKRSLDQANLEYLLEYIDFYVADNDKAECRASVKNMSPAEREWRANKIEAALAEAMPSKEEAKVIPLRPTTAVEDDEDHGDDHTVAVDGTFTIVENLALDHPDPRIRGREKMVYVLLDYHCHFPKKTSWPSIMELSDLTGWKRDTIRAALDNLIAVGLVKQEPVGRGYKWTIVHRHRPKKKSKKARDWNQQKRTAS